MKKFELVIIGGGSAGITCAARAQNSGQFASIAVIDPSEVHFYQPLWTLVGAGQFKISDTARAMKSVIPSGVTWLQEKCLELLPESNQVKTDKGLVSYDYLVVATGIIPDWDHVEGLAQTIGQNQVCSIYDSKYAEYTFETVDSLKGGNVLFTMPGGLLKCGGAPQKIMWLTDDYYRVRGDRDKFQVHFYKEGNGIFGVEKYKEVLEKMVIERSIHTHFLLELVKVDGTGKQAIFKDSSDGSEHTVSFDMLHVVPHFKTHEYLQNIPLSNERGEVIVDKYTLQSPKFSNVFSLGDCSGCPTGKTGAAVRKEAPVLIANLIASKKGQPISRSYNGYTACPILTRHNRVMLAEFDYDGKPCESFPFNQAKERYSMYLFKKYLLPFLYWNFMLKGRM